MTGFVVEIRQRLSASFDTTRIPRDDVSMSVDTTRPSRGLSRVMISAHSLVVPGGGLAWVLTQTA
jgi:hypothetical protein